MQSESELRGTMEQYHSISRSRPMHVMDFLNAEPIGQSWLQFGELGLAFILSSVIGLEREFRAKSAGLRTHTLVGVAAALIVLVSKYGFGDTIVKDAVVLDPSRVAAQIVSGIGFIGGGLIFVQRDVVRGLTTAAKSSPSSRPKRRRKARCVPSSCT